MELDNNTIDTDVIDSGSPIRANGQTTVEDIANTSFSGLQLKEDTSVEGVYSNAFIPTSISSTEPTKDILGNTFEGVSNTYVNNVEVDLEEAINNTNMELYRYTLNQQAGTEEDYNNRVNSLSKMAQAYQHESFVFANDTFNEWLVDANTEVKPGFSAMFNDIDLSATEDDNEVTNDVIETSDTKDNNFTIDDTEVSAEGASLTAKWESGGDYTTYGDIGDGAGITAGKYQFTEESGSLGKVAKELGFDSVKAKGFKEALGTEEGMQVQDKVYTELYAKPAIAKAKELGITEPKAVSFLIDTHLNGGLDSVLKSAKGDYSLDNLIKVRQSRYERLARKKDKKKFLKGWSNRMNDWKKLV